MKAGAERAASVLPQRAQGARGEPGADDAAAAGGAEEADEGAPPDPYAAFPDWMRPQPKLSAVRRAALLEARNCAHALAAAAVTPTRCAAL